MNAFRFALLISLTLTLSTHKTKPMGIDTTKKNSARRNSKEESKFPGLNDYETFIAAQKMFERFDDHRKTIKNAEDLTPLKFTDDAEQVVQGLKYGRSLFGGAFEAIHTPWGSRFTNGLKNWSLKEITPVLKTTNSPYFWTIPSDDDGSYLIDILEVDNKKLPLAILIKRAHGPSAATVAAAYTKLLEQYNKESQTKEATESKESTLRHRRIPGGAIVPEE